MHFDEIVNMSSQFLAMYQLDRVSYIVSSQSFIQASHLNCLYFLSPAEHQPFVPYTNIRETHT